MVASAAKFELKPFEVGWEKLPNDFVLPDDSGDDVNRPPLAAALTDTGTANKLSATTLKPTNYGICATLNQRMVIKALN